MTIIDAIILGIVEGFTEFLPISSTAHLIITSKLLKISANDFIKFFEVFIQSGAILAVLFLYLKYVLKNKDLILKIILSFIATSVFAFSFYKVIKNVFFDSMGLIAFNLIFIGILIILFESLIKNGKINLNKDLKMLNFKDAFLIGIIQALSIMPGVSRAGAVILAMFILNYKREEAVLYSFLLSIPTILSAGFFDLYKIGFKSFAFSSEYILITFFGFLFAFLSALFVIKAFIKFLEKNNLQVFGYYRIILGILVILFFLV